MKIHHVRMRCWWMEMDVMTVESRKVMILLVRMKRFGRVR